MRIALIAALLLSGCAGESIGDVVSNTIEGAARSACRSADNCQDLCANGAVVEKSRAICVPGP